VASRTSRDQEALLADIEVVHGATVLADHHLDELVLAAHAAGVSWERIAVRLKVTRQAVSEKYGEMERRRRSDEFNKEHGR